MSKKKLGDYFDLKTVYCDGCKFAVDIEKSILYCEKIKMHIQSNKPRKCVFKSKK